ELADRSRLRARRDDAAPVLAPALRLRFLPPLRLLGEVLVLQAPPHELRARALPVPLRAHPPRRRALRLGPAPARRPLAGLARAGPPAPPPRRSAAASAPAPCSGPAPPPSRGTRPRGPGPAPRPPRSPAGAGS